MGPGGMPFAAGSAVYEEVPSGARLVLTPDDAANLEQLRAQVRARAERMASGQCPMMRHGSTAAQSAEPETEHSPEHHQDN